MLPIGVVGLNHKSATLKQRERFVKVCQRRFQAGTLVQGSHAFVLLSTCNRIEVYFSAEDLPAIHSYVLEVLRQEGLESAEPNLYSYFGIDCFNHLARVTSGVDSAILGETEIQGQVKKAYEAAAAFGGLPKALHFAFQKSLKIGKGLRSSLLRDQSAPALEHTIHKIGLGAFDCKLSPRVLFVGASEINSKVLSFLVAKGWEDITLCNRSFQGALDMASKHGVQACNWSVLEDWNNYDWVLVGTKAEDYLLTPEALKPAGETQLVLDLSVPRNAHPLLGQSLQLYNLDQLHRMVSRRRAKIDLLASEAELAIRDQTTRLVEVFARRSQIPMEVALARA